MAYSQDQSQIQEQQFVGPTLCIFRVHQNIRRERIFAVFRQLNLGWIGKIDIVPKKIVERNPDGTVSTKEFHSAFIHFTKWFERNHQTQQFLERLDSGGFVHIIYDEPRFWKITKYVPKEHKPQSQSRYPRPRIDFGTTAAAAAVKKSELSAPPSPPTTAQIVPIQVTRHLQSVSVRGGSESKKKYWEQQAKFSTLAAMTTDKHYSTSPTPRSHGSDSESSPSPIIQRNVSVRLFD
jgi:hypothetical protein